MQIETDVPGMPFVPVLKVMLVDDNLKFLEAAARFLETGPAIQIVARLNSTREALEKIKEIRPDLVLLDLNMPEMSGLEATRLIKGWDNPPRVVLLSMRDDQEYYTAAIAARADGLISKSEFGDRILGLIGKMFNRPPNP